MSDKNKKRHPADAELMSNAENVPVIHVDPPVTDAKSESIQPNAGSAAIPTYEEKAPPKGTQLPGSDDRRTGAGAKDAPERSESVDGF